MSKEKKNFKDTDFGKFIGKVGGVLPEVGEVALSVIGGNYTGAIAKTASIIKGEIDKGGKKAEEAKVFLNEFEMFKMTFEKECFELEAADRDSARNLYSTDGLIQKVLAIVFTLAYFSISYFLFNHFITKEVKLSDFEIGFISTIFGGMSTKVNTIIDFFFGGSVK